MSKWRVANFVEIPGDEYDNRLYTAGQACVISAEVEPGTGKPGTLVTILHVIEPETIKGKWATLSARNWIETDHEPGPISEETWKSLVSVEHSDITK